MRIRCIYRLDTQVAYAYCCKSVWIHHLQMRNIDTTMTTAYSIGYSWPLISELLLLLLRSENRSFLTFTRLGVCLIIYNNTVLLVLALDLFILKPIIFILNYPLVLLFRRNWMNFHLQILIIELLIAFNIITHLPILPF